MILSEYAHCFEPVGNSSIDMIKTRCIDNFLKYIIHFVGNRIDGENTSIQNYDIFDGLYGEKITYNNKNIQFVSDIQNVHQELERFVKKSISDRESIQPSPRLVSFEEKEEIAFSRLMENVEKDGKTYKRYDCLFGAGEFPFLILKIARIGNKDYFWYVLSR